MKDKYSYLKFGEIKPKGWIYKQMYKDLTKGFVGHLDKLVPELILGDDIYGNDRLTKNLKSKDVGAIIHSEGWEVQYLWWNSETQSNWWDGLIRHAALLDNKGYLDMVKKYIDRILSYQDVDGYMGIYDKDLRYNFEGENGELWAQATLFRGLLAYYELTGEQRVLNAVEAAILVTMKYYPIHASTPFKAKDPFAGICHGLAIVDVLERLYQITKKEMYMEYAVWLYEDYSSHELSEEDIQLKHLLDDSYSFKGHGVHTYEHLRAVIISAYYSEDNKFKKALSEYLKKLSICICPSGGPIGDEWIGGKAADPSLNGYEYCSIHELLHSYTLLLQKSGDVNLADKVEWLLFNAGQGSRHKSESSIAYLKSDNSYAMEGVFQNEQPNVPHKVQTRYRYSPTHQEAAVCCVPNAGRIYPYYIQAMWMKSSKGIIAMLYGPCELKTEINGVSVRINAETQYPFNDDITFEISVEKAVEFEIGFRKPAWCEGVEILCKEIQSYEKDNIIYINKKWNDGEKIQIKFKYAVAEHSDFQGDSYISYGPLVFCLPIEGKCKVVKEFEQKDFRELQYTAVDDIPEYLEFKRDAKNSFSVDKAEVDEQNPWEDKLRLRGKLYNSLLKKDEEVTLVPMGGTILRKVTFKK